MPTDRQIKKVEAAEAKHGEKMIEIKVRFWTNDLAKEADKIRPKHAWSSGVVRKERNESHGIAPDRSIPFNSLPELPWIIEELLLEQGVTLHLSSRARRYMKV